MQTRKPKTSVDTSEVGAAQRAGLRYVTDSVPGIRRKGLPGDFRYTAPSGKALRLKATLARIRALVIPPAWSDVWICPHANGHIQVTARDARGRKQYRYHARWREIRDSNKYDQLQDFVRVLPTIRAAASKHLRLQGLPREKVLAAVVSLLEKTFIRIGNKEYARTNGSFGLTTLRNRHVRISGSCLNFTFRGKSGKQHRITLTDPKLAAIVRRCRDLPGQELFQYLDEAGETHKVSSADVNDYLSTISGGQAYTAKDFRTWAGTVLAMLELYQCTDFQTETQAKKNVVEAIRRVAQRLGNTPSICRKCYVHPKVLDAYFERRLNVPGFKGISENAVPGLTRRQEMAVLRLLRNDNGRNRKTIHSM